jgi:hypothetical protein
MWTIHLFSIWDEGVTLYVFQYCKLLGSVILFRLTKKNCYINIFIYVQTQIHVQLCFLWYITESNFGGQKSSQILIFSSTNIPNSLGVVILLRLMKITAISANLFTPEHKLLLNCTLCGILVNLILEDQKAARFWYLCLPILQTIRALWFCFV